MTGPDEPLALSANDIRPGTASHHEWTFEIAYFVGFRVMKKRRVA
jgi:hypothetical protein